MAGSFFQEVSMMPKIDLNVVVTKFMSSRMVGSITISARTSKVMKEGEGGGEE